MKQRFWVLFAVLLPFGCTLDDAPSGPRIVTDYSGVVAALTELIELEREAWGIPAMSIALVDGAETVWAAGFGEEGPGAPASSGTVYRVGSVSKLFTDLGIMQLVEQGRIDLDAPVRTYLPSFAPRGAGVDGISLRHLMSHRSGLVREPPAGHYFDDSEPSLEVTVASLNGTELVYPVGERTKYSNAAIATVGRVLEAVTGESFVPYLQREVIDRLGMAHSAFEPTDRITEHLARAQMWTYHGVRFPAPTFELGMAPAGSMFSTVEDLGLFLASLFAGGEGSGGTVVSRATLDEMWTPQFTEEGSTETGYGIGFRLFQVEGHRAIGHGGAIYGFSTELEALPEAGLGVVVVSSLDGSGAAVTRVANAALELMLATRSGASADVPSVPTAVGQELAQTLDGSYGEGVSEVRLTERNGELFFSASRGGGTYRLGRSQENLVTHDVHGAGISVGFDNAGEWIEVGGRRLERSLSRLPAPPPSEWTGLIGEYGWDYNVLYVYESGGALRTLIEWFFDYPLEPLSGDAFAFPDFGLYHGENLVFQRDASGRATSVDAAGVRFLRRDVGTAEGVTFRVDPVRPVAALREVARAASPPDEAGEFRTSELIEVTSIDPSIHLDIRYASTNNFMGAVFYEEPRAFLQRPAAEAVVRAHEALEAHGLGILIHDGYRPWFVTKMFWDATPESEKVFVANPANGSRHNRGSAVDLTLYDRETGVPIRMVGGYDEFSPRSYPNYPGGTSQERWYRELLRDVMEAEGFTVYEAEWWHFDHGDWRLYPILNREFSELGG